MDRIYYVSQGKSPKEHVKNIQNVCEAGVQLVQLRMKGVEDEIYLETANKVLRITEKHGAELIVNDNWKVAHTLGCGVHLGKEDEAPAKVRETIGADGIIGATANTFADCLALIGQSVNYIGLGPFRFTMTKEGLSPVLGAEGYEKIIAQLRAEGQDVPVYAIGGIVAEDIPRLIDAGVSGIAVSGLLSGKPLNEVKKIVAQMEVSIAESVGG